MPIRSCRLSISPEDISATSRRVICQPWSELKVFLTARGRTPTGAESPLRNVGKNWMAETSPAKSVARVERKRNPGPSLRSIRATIEILARIKTGQISKETGSRVCSARDM